MELDIHFKCNSKKEINSKNSFPVLTIGIIIAIVISIFWLTYNKYNFYIRKENENAVINAVYNSTN